MLTSAETIFAGLALAALGFVLGKLRGRKRPVIVMSSACGSTDSWEGSFSEARDPRELEVDLEISYTDGAGSSTTRRVRTRSFDLSLHGGILIGHCSLRGETRTFRFDRVRSAIALDTGEAIANLRQFMQERLEASPESSYEALTHEYRDALRVLLYVAKADGQFRREERAIVRDFCREVVEDSRLSDSRIDRILSHLEVPSLHGFKLAFGYVLNEQPCSPQALLDLATKIVDTQKTRRPGEQEALEYMEQRLERFQRESR